MLKSYALIKKRLYKRKELTRKKNPNLLSENKKVENSLKPLKKIPMSKLQVLKTIFRKLLHSKSIQCLKK
jgi:hypothetical protein